MKINWNVEQEPSCNGYYIVEVQMCDVPDKTQLFIDEFRSGYWGHGQFVNKWAEIEGWIKADIKPPMNLGVLVYIPGEDGHMTSGMWDESEKWVLLDEYRVPECEVTHWTMLPEEPEEPEESTPTEVTPLPEGFISVETGLPHFDMPVKCFMSDGTETIGYRHDNRNRSCWMTMYAGGLYANQAWLGKKVIGWK